MKDAKGRQFIAHHEVRGAFVTVSAEISTGTATVIGGGDADYFTDIVEISFANESTASAHLDLKTDGTTAKHISLRANETLHLKFDAPLEQQTKNTPWIADMDDTTGTTVAINGTLVRRNA